MNTQYERPFGQYRSANRTFCDITVTNVTGFPHLYQVINRKGGFAIPYRYTRKQLDDFLARYQYSPIVDETAAGA